MSAHSNFLPVNQLLLRGGRRDDPYTLEEKEPIISFH